MTLSSRMLHKTEPRNWKSIKYAAGATVAALDIVVFAYLCSWLARYIGWVNAEKDPSLLGRLHSILRNVNIVYFVTGILELLMALTGFVRACMVLGKVTAKKKKLVRIPRRCRECDSTNTDRHLECSSSLPQWQLYLQRSTPSLVRMPLL